MHLKNKAAGDMTDADFRLLEAAPKTVLYAMAKHLAAAQAGDSYELALESGAYLTRMIEEWENLNRAGIVPQKPSGKVKALGGIRE